MRVSGRAWRTAAGVAVLAALAYLGAQLIPLYLRNLELQRFLEETAGQSASLENPDDLLRTRIADRAARLGLPVSAEQVRLLRSDGKLWIAVRYTVPVDLPLYAVDLHFHPKAGDR